jgi:hypothetical protein
MRQLVLSTWICLGLAASFPIAGSLMILNWLLALFIFILIMIWILGVKWRRRWAVTFSLVGFSMALAYGEWIGLKIGWSVVSIVFLLIAWDLQWFIWRIDLADRVEDEKELLRSHVLRLVIISIAGLLLAGVTQLIRVRFSFGIALLLGFLVILGLQRWILIANRAGE